MIKLLSKKKSALTYLAGAAVFVCFVVVLFAIERYKGVTEEASSATFYEVRGHAWSATIGWISFSCKDGGPTANNICGTSNYKVETDATGVLQGYAWSDNVGWISFNENSGCPNAPCRPTIDAGGMTGWARVVSPFSPTDPNPDRGGWDGWINLNSSTPFVYRVARASNDLLGHAWGDINLGWLSFNCVNGGPTLNNICGTSNYKVWLDAIVIPDPTLTFTLPTHAYVGESKQLDWSTTNVNTCTASGNWSGSRATTTGSQSTGVFGSQGSFSYTLSCLNTVYNIPIEGTRVIQVTDGICGGTETVPANPFDCTSVVNRFEANPKIVREGRSSRLEWNITAGQNCALYGPTNNLIQNIPNGNQVGSYNLTNITTKQTYRISCSGGVNVNATVSVYLLYEY
jgi:hypothetical protein